jgi:hypothetical protein
VFVDVDAWVLGYCKYMFLGDLAGHRLPKVCGARGFLNFGNWLFGDQSAQVVGWAGVKWVGSVCGTARTRVFRANIRISRETREFCTLMCD